MFDLKSTAIAPRVVQLLDQIKEWARGRSDTSAVALAGSHAHGRARPDSDVDLIVLSDDPDPLRTGDWLAAFGRVETLSTEQWGVLTAHRVNYSVHGEVEVGVAPSSWADIPVDSGTYEVVHDGIISVYDPRGILAKLITEVQRTMPG